jgi:hypothetical protein
MNFPYPGRSHRFPSDMLNPHERPFTGMLYRHPRSASGRSGCSLFFFSLGGPPFLVPVSVALADGHCCIVVTGAQGSVVRVIGEDDAADAELVDQGCRVGGTGHLARAAFPAAQFADVAGEQDADSGQVRQDLVLAHVRVLRPARIWAGGARVTVTAAVGRVPIQNSSLVL